MKVYNLGCAHDHRFEGWFGSADEFESQRARGLLECPLCASRDVRRLPSAPRLNLSGAAAPQADVAPQPARRPAPAAGTDAAPHTAPQSARQQAVQAAWMALARQVVASTEDVGGRFAEEARRIHYREAPPRAIRGQATPEQTAELADEGIEVFTMPLPAALKEPMQ